MRNKNQNVYTVGQVNSYIKNIFDQDYMLRRDLRQRRSKQL